MMARDLLEGPSGIFFVISFQNEMLSPTRAPGPTEHP